MVLVAYIFPWVLENVSRTVYKLVLLYNVKHFKFTFERKVNVAQIFSHVLLLLLVPYDIKSCQVSKDALAFCRNQLFGLCLFYVIEYTAYNTFLRNVHLFVSWHLLRFKTTWIFKIITFYLSYISIKIALMHFQLCMSYHICKIH